MPLDVSLMSRAAAYLVGEHDFRSFCSVDTQAQTTVRRIDNVDVWEEGADSIKTAVAEETVYTAGGKTLRTGREIVIRVAGRGFLYNMVRIIAGTLMEVGRGRIPPDGVKDILASCDRQKAGPTAPACGLTLVGYEFL